MITLRGGAIDQHDHAVAKTGVLKRRAHETGASLAIQDGNPIRS
jgi:hypothetical protein